MRKLKKKAFLGAIIGAATSIGGSILNGNAQRRANRRRRIEDIRNSGFEQAAAMTNSLNNDYVDEYNNKIVLRNGGKVKLGYNKDKSINVSNKDGSFNLDEVTIKGKKPSKFNRIFRNATIGAAMAENPSVMTASGWNNNTRDWKQKRTKGSDKLAENLAVLSTTSPTHPISAMLDATIPIGLKAVNNINKKINKYNIIARNNRNNTISNISNNTFTSRKALPAPKTNNKINIIKSSGKVYRLPDQTPTEAANYRDWIKTRMNKWTSHYGYEPVPLNNYGNHIDTDKIIQNRLRQHNTFARGVVDVDGTDRIKINDVLRKEGIKPNKENRLIYMAEHVPKDTQLNRKGIVRKVDGEGHIYVSNGYGVPYRHIRQNKNKGAVFKIERPVDFSSKNRNDWINNAEFNLLPSQDMAYPSFLYDLEYTPKELPYLLKTGKGLRSKIAKDLKLKDKVRQDLNGNTGKDAVKNSWKKVYRKNDPRKYFSEYLNKEDINNINTTYAIGTERPKRTSRNKGNPFMNYAFPGHVGERKFRVVDRINKDSYKDIEDHVSEYGYNNWDDFLSRKSRRFGGKVNTNKKLLP